MTMKIRSFEEVPGQGKIVLIYSEAGVGKTTSCFQSLPEPILNIKTEPRNPNISIQASGRKGAKIDIVNFTNWEEYMAFLAVPETFDAYKSVMVDSLSYLMNILLSSEIEDQAFDARSDAEKKVKPIVMRTKMSLEGFGGLASQMSRSMKLLGNLSERGKYVVLTCLLQENPKWDRDLSAAPALKGKEFATNIASYCDLIGLVEHRYEEKAVKGKKEKEVVRVYPPRVNFEGEGFMQKFTGLRHFTGKAAGPLDFRKILGIEDDEAEKNKSGKGEGET